VEASQLAQGPGHPFYRRLNEILEQEGFDELAEHTCKEFYAERMGRPSLAPAVYFRLLLIGYFEGIDSERGIAWRVADSITLREFLGLALTEPTVDHSTISRNRRLIDVEAHQEVFVWVLRVLARRGLLRGKSLGVDATTLEANAALRSIVRRETGESYEEFLTALAQASGIETPTREQLGQARSEAAGERFEPRLEASPRSGCPDHPHEGRSHAPGSQGRACGGPGDGCDRGGDPAARGSGRHEESG